MSPINLAATIVPDARVRLTYRLSTTDVGASLFGFAGDPLQNTLDDLNAAWQANPQAVLYAPAVAPAAGGGLLQTDYFVSLDVKTAHSLPSISWDAWVSPYRDNSGAAGGGLFSVQVPFELTAVELLEAGTPAAAPAARTGSQQSAADLSKASSPSLGSLVSSYGSAIVIALVAVVLIVLLARYGRGGKSL